MLYLKNLMWTMVGLPRLGKTQVVSAGAWTVFELGFGHLLRLASNLVMTRFLLPDAFALMAIVLTVHVAVELFTDIGIRPSIIRSQHGAEPSFLRVAWSVQILRAGLLSAIMLAIAGLLKLLGPVFGSPGTVYSDQALPGLIALSTAAIMLRGLESTALPLAQRQMRLARVAAVGIIGQTVTLFAMLSLVQIMANVWVLVGGLLFGSLVRTVLTHTILTGPTMYPLWDGEIVGEIWNFGKWLIGASFLGYVANYADRLILAGLVLDETFGYYVIAMLWVDAAGQMVQRLNGRVGMPAISKVMRESPDRLPEAFARYRWTMDLICVAGFGGLFFFGKPLVEFLYPPNYAVAGGFITLLAFRLLTLRYQVFGSLLLSRADGRAIFIIAVLRATALVLACLMGFYVAGMIGAVLGVALSFLAGAPLLMLRTQILSPARLRLEYALISVLVLVAVFYGSTHG